MSTPTNVGRRLRWRLLVVALAAAATWWLLGLWVVSASERLYVLVPPVALAVAALLSPNPWQEVRTQLRGAVPFFGLLVGGAAAFNLLLVVQFYPNNPLRAFRGGEVLLAAYFILALKLLATGPMHLLRRPLWYLHDRLFPATERPQWRERLRRHLVELVLAPVLVPLILGAVFIHRFKLPNLPDTEEVAGWPRDNVTFTTDDGFAIRGWFFPARHAPSGRTVIICHGLSSNRTAFLPLVMMGDSLKANVLLFDFRGHGDSDGHTVTFGHREKYDVLAAVHYLRTQRPDQARELVGLGISMGTAALIRAAAEVEPPLDAVVIDSGYASAIELTGNVLRPVPAFLRPALAAPAVPLASLDAGCWLPDVRPVEQVSRLRAPVLVVHAREDTLIPLEHGQRLFDAATHPKQLWIADTGGHGSAHRAWTEYVARIGRLLDERPAATGD